MPATPIQRGREKTKFAGKELNETLQVSKTALTGKRATVNETNIGTVSKATLVKLLRGGVNLHTWAFPRVYIPS